MSRVLLAAADPRENAQWACDVRRLVDVATASQACGDTYLFAAAAEPDGAHRADDVTLRALAGVVLPHQGAHHAHALLAAGARRVLLGEAALADSELVHALATRYGNERIGVYVPARRLEISWSFDAVSNADFKVLTPSVGAPAWEILRHDGSRSGVQAAWWIGEMFKRGASEALLRVDIDDDADLNLCAECVERFGERLRIGPLDRPAADLLPWVRYGHARHLVLAPARYTEVHARSAALLDAAEGRRRAERAA